jgi:preprotein translocase subunit SecE
MARNLPRRDDVADDNEEILEESEESTEAGVPAAPAVSDSRRRRLAKKGIVVDAAPTIEKKNVPTPSPYTSVEKREKSSNPVVRFFQNFLEYFRDVRSELRKVTWPTREDVQRLTTIVLIVTAIAALFLGLVSFLFSLLTAEVARDASSVIAGLATIGIIVVVAGLWLFRDRLFDNSVS